MCIHLRVKLDWLYLNSYSERLWLLCSLSGSIDYTLDSKEKMFLSILGESVVEGLECVNKIERFSSSNALSIKKLGALGKEFDVVKEVNFQIHAMVSF